MVIDIILIILLILMMLYGYKKGFIGIVAKIVSLIIAFILGYLLAETVGGYIAETGFGQKISTSIENSIMGKLESKEDTVIISMVQEKLNLADEQSLLEKIIGYVFTGIGFVAVFIVARIVLWIAQKILESIFELPVLRTFNKLGGVVTSAILFFIEVLILLGVIKSISMLTFMTPVINFIESSVITKAVYDHNIITTLILGKII